MQVSRQPMRVLGLLCVLAGCLLTPRVCPAEGPALPAAEPTVAAIVPAGLQQGTSVNITVTGTNLAGAKSVRVSGGRLTVELVPPADMKTSNATQAMLQLTAAADAQLGMRELRIETAGGLSNVARLMLGSYAEVTESEPNDTPATAMKLEQLPVVVNGHLNRNEDRDVFRFTAKAGQKLVFDLHAQRLHPLVNTGRPAWLEGFLSVREVGELSVAADAKLAADATVAEKGKASKTAANAVAASQTGIQKAVAEKSVAEKAWQAKTDEVAAATKQAQMAAATVDKLRADLAAAKKQADDKTAAAKAASSEVAALSATMDPANAEKLAQAKGIAEKASTDKNNAEKIVDDLSVAEKKAAESLVSLSANSTQFTKDQTAAEKALRGKVAAVTAAQEKLNASQAAAKLAADELAGANRIAAEHKAVVDRLAEAPSRNLAYSHGLDGREDPLLVFDVPKDGQYAVEVRDELYRGRTDFNYRLTMGEIPCVLSSFPAGVRRDTPTTVNLVGVNLLDANSITVHVPAAVSASQQFERISNSLGTSNDFALQIGDTAEALEVEPNSPDEAQPVELPVILHGVIERDGDLDCWSFAAKKGDRLIFETFSRSFGSPLDPRLELLDDKGRRIKESDDNNSTAESLLDHTFSADGTYKLCVSDTTGVGSNRHVYRLSARPPQSDFSLRVSPDSPRVAAGGTTLLKVNVQRRAGFAGDVELALTNPPPGAIVSPATVAGTATEQIISITMPNDAPQGLFPLSVIGKAKNGEEQLVRSATPAEPIRYNNDWRYVPVEDVILTVVPAVPATIAWGQGDATLVAGESVKVPIRIERIAGFTAPVRVVLDGLPPRITAPPVTVAEGVADAVVEIRSANNAPAGLANIVANGTLTLQGKSFVQSSPVLRLTVAVPVKK